MGAESLIGLLQDQLRAETESNITGIEPLQVQDRQGSLAVQCRLLYSDGQESCVWAKVLRPSDPPEIKELRIARDYDITSFLYERLGAEGHYRVPKPVFHSPSQRLIVTEHVCGTRFQNKLEDQAMGRVSDSVLRDLQADCRRTGEWLRHFQLTTEHYRPGDRLSAGPKRVKDARRIVEQTLQRLSELQKGSSIVGASLGEALETFLWQNLKEHDGAEDTPCSIHGDFFPGNILVNGDKVIGIDFSSATWGSRHFDPAYYIFQLETLRDRWWKYRPAVIDSLVNAFVEGYGISSSGVSIWNRTPVFRILFVALTVSRLLSLTESAGKGGISARAIYKRVRARRLVARLKSHIGTH